MSGAGWVSAGKPVVARTRLLTAIRTGLLGVALGFAMRVAAADPPDLSGVWSVVKPLHALKTIDGATPPLTPAARAVYDQHIKAAAQGDRSFDGTTRCLPPGLPRLMYRKEPFEILQKPKVIYFIFQLNRLPRRLYIGEPLPTDPDPHWLGYSVARWDGAALVVESAGFNDLTVLDDAGMPHSEDLHLTERYELSADGKHLHARFTIDDPKTFTHPWIAGAEYVKRPGYEIPEEVCMDKFSRPHPAH
jgi:hypothetical protein